MMQVTAKFSFELSFPIKMQGSWSRKPQSITTDLEEIVAYAPAVSAPPRSEEPVWKPDPKHLIGGVKDKLFWEAKYIVIDIRRDFLTIPIEKADQEALIAKARNILYKILTLYRWQERQLQINVRNIEQVNYRIWYYDVAGNLINAGPEGVQKTGEVHLTAKTLPRVDKWDDICQHLASGIMPELYESLILDAYSVVNQEPRRAVLDAATACEVFIENFCETASKSSPKVDPIIYSALQQSKKREGEVLFYFHEMLRYLFGHSLKADKPDLYEKLYYLCKTNNFVKHEGKCQYKEKDKKGKIKKVNAPEAREFINAVEDAIQYTKSLAY